MKRRDFLVGAGAGAAGVAAGVVGDRAVRVGRLSADKQASSGKAPAVVSGREVGTEWKIQTSWPSGVGLEVFKEWCAGIVEQTSGELAFKPFGANDLVGEFQLFDAVQRGELEAMNPFTQYWSGRAPAAAFLASYPMGLRNPHEWDVFYYSLGGIDLARELFAQYGLHYVGPVQHGANIIHSKVPIRSIEDFKGRRIRLPGGMVAALFQAAGAKTTMLPGTAIFPALKDDVIDAADYVGPAVNYALGFHEVTSYICMGPPGLMSVYQPVDLMDITVGMEAWNALPKRLQDFVETEVHVYSDTHLARVEAADQDAWHKFEEAGTEITRLSAADVAAFTELAIPIWFEWANRDKAATRIFKAQLDYMMSGSLGYVTPEAIKGHKLQWQ